MRESERGNAVLFILIGVALFGALIYTFMRGSQQGQGNLTAQQAKAGAQDLISYANTVRMAVDRLRQKGCSENEINFYNGIYKHVNGTLANVDNAQAPSDDSCDVFSTNGGNLEPILFPKTYQGDSGGANIDTIILAQANIKDIGTSAGDIVLVIPHVNQQICEEINSQLGVGKTSDGKIPYSVVQPIWPGPWDGSEFAPLPIGYETTTAPVAGKSAFCAGITANVVHKMFYTVILPR